MSRGYRLEIIDEDSEQWGIVPQENGEDKISSDNRGVVRSGLDDALYWIKVQEELRR